MVWLLLGNPVQNTLTWLPFGFVVCVCVAIATEECGVVQYLIEVQVGAGA